VSRLFLASDILHNSTAPVRNASRYRARLEDALPAIFESLQQTYRNAPGRMAQVGTPFGSLAWISCAGSTWLHLASLCSGVVRYAQTAGCAPSSLCMEPRSA
jgi:U2-associated protein SR140